MAMDPQVLSQLADRYYDEAANASLEQTIRPVVVESLQKLNSTENSIANAAQLCQSLYSKDAAQLRVCVKIIADFFSACDSRRQISVFYVLHDLIQREPRARSIFLRVAFPQISWLAGDAPYRESVEKSIGVWRDRGVYIPPLCDVLLRALDCRLIARDNQLEANKRFESLVELLDIAGSKHAELDEILPLRSTTTAEQLRDLSGDALQDLLNLYKEALVTTQETLLFAARLAIDFNESTVLPNLQHQRQICLALQHAAEDLDGD